jgi:hypothetical protein
LSCAGVMTVVLPKGPFVVAPHPAVGANRREPASGVPGKQAYPQYVGRPQALHQVDRGRVGEYLVLPSVPCADGQQMQERHAAGTEGHGKLICCAVAWSLVMSTVWTCTGIPTATAARMPQTAWVKLSVHGCGRDWPHPGRRG